MSDARQRELEDARQRDSMDAYQRELAGKPQRKLTEVKQRELADAQKCALVDAQKRALAKALEPLFNASHFYLKRRALKIIMPPISNAYFPNFLQLLDTKNDPLDEEESYLDELLQQLNEEIKDLKNANSSSYKKIKLLLKHYWMPITCLMTILSFAGFFVISNSKSRSMAFVFPILFFFICAFVAGFVGNLFATGFFWADFKKHSVALLTNGVQQPLQDVLEELEHFKACFTEELKNSYPSYEDLEKAINMLKNSDEDLQNIEAGDTYSGIEQSNKVSTVITALEKAKTAIEKMKGLLYILEIPIGYRPVKFNKLVDNENNQALKETGRLKESEKLLWRACSSIFSNLRFNENSKNAPQKEAYISPANKGVTSLTEVKTDGTEIPLQVINTNIEDEKFAQDNFYYDGEEDEGSLLINY